MWKKKKSKSEKKKKEQEGFKFNSWSEFSSDFLHSAARISNLY
jgi:hypothetical protein